MMSNAEKIAAWREANPGKGLDAESLSSVLEVVHLQDAYLRDTNLQDAYLRDADLRGADLRVLTVDGLPSGRVALIPTCDGWDLSVGCWSGSVSDLEKLIATNEGWPEAIGEECDRRRPGLQALVALCRASMDANASIITELTDRWGDR